jgi:putative ABC transport system permease protein
MDRLWNDFRHAVRALRLSPGFTLIAVLTVALGVGANAAMFTVADAVLLKPLPYGAPERLAMIWSRWVDFPDKTWISASEHRLYRERSRAFEDVAAFAQGSLAILSGVSGVSGLSGDGEPERVAAAFVTPNLLSVLGVLPAHGRSFREGEEVAGNDQVILLSDRLWHRRFAGDPKVVGSTIQVGGTPYEVIGVLPPGLKLPLQFAGDAAELWVPLQADPAAAGPFPKKGGSHGWYGVGRLAPGATLAGAQADLDALIGGLAAEGIYPPAMQFEPVVVPVAEQVTGAVRPALLVLLGAVGFVLLIACVNVVSLLLARGEAREREIAVRAALGASRRDLVRQLLAENLVLALLGGAAGLWLATFGLDLLAGRNVGVPRLTEAAVGGRALLFTLVVTLVTGLLFGLAPALRISRPDLQGALKDGGRGTGPGGRRQGLRHGLVIAEVALAVVLVTGAGLVLQSVWRLLQVDAGTKGEERVLTLRLTAPATTYPEVGQVAELYRGLLAKVRALPEVESAGAGLSLPLTGALGDWGLDVEGYQPPPDDNPKGDWQVVTPGYFEALGIPVRLGRAFSERDHADAPRAVVVNETMARAYWPGGAALGRRLRTRAPGDPWMTVVGVVADVRHDGLTGEPRKIWYRPQAQMPAGNFTPRALSLAVRARPGVDPLRLVAPVRALARAADAGMPISEVRTMAEIRDTAISRERFTLLLLAAFGTLALTLAAIGIYGVLAYWVARRTHEIGVRLAVGARRRDVLGHVVGQSLALTAAGLALGLLGAQLLGRTLEGLLYGVTPADPWTLAGVALLLGTVALLAGLLPAHRAASLDPLAALRGD